MCWHVVIVSVAKSSEHGVSGLVQIFWWWFVVICLLVERHMIAVHFVDCF